MSEAGRIVDVYRRRESDLPERQSWFGYEGPAHLLRIDERVHRTLAMLSEAGVASLAGRTILDVGCGNGGMLANFVRWGASPRMTYGIEVRPDACRRAAALNPLSDIRCASAERLPWPDATFDLVTQHTVFTSILDSRIRGRVAGEMARVLRPGGVLLWYDFMYDNPWNPDVRGVPRAEIARLFPGFGGHFERITLAPFVARRIPRPVLRLVYPALSSVPWLRTHCLAVLTKR